MLIDRYEPEDVFSRTLKLADEIDPVHVQLDRLLDDDRLYQEVQHDLACRYRLTPSMAGIPRPAEATLRLLVISPCMSGRFAGASFEPTGPPSDAGTDA